MSSAIVIYLLIVLLQNDQDAKISEKMMCSASVDNIFAGKTGSGGEVGKIPCFQGLRLFYMGRIAV